MLLSMFSGLSLPVTAKAAASSSDNKVTTRDIDENTYKSLKLDLKVDEDEAPVPYDTGSTVQLRKVSEVYAAANGIDDNVYTVRNGFDRINSDKNRTPDVSDGGGNLDGAYEYYNISGEVETGKGGTIGSKISSNRGNSMKNAYNGFSGIYATSVAFDAGDGKDNYIAELRAYGDKSTTKYNNVTYKGKIQLEIFKIDSDGERIAVGKYTPSYNASSFITGSHMAYFGRRYVQELDAMFEVEKADINGDGKDDIFVYTGEYVDESGIRKALVDVYIGDGKGAFHKGNQLKIASGESSKYGGGDTWHQTIYKIPVVGLASGDLDRNGDDELAVTVSASVGSSDLANQSFLSVYNFDGGIKEYPGLEHEALKGGAAGMASANCTFGDFMLPDGSVAVTTIVTAGYEAQDSSVNGKAAYRYFYINPVNGTVVKSGFMTHELGSKSSKIFNSYSSNDSNTRFRPVYAPFPLACADLEGVNGSAHSDSILFGGEIYSFKADEGINDEIGSISLCSSQVKPKKDSKEKEQIWIGEVSAGCIDTDPEAVRYRESFICVVGTHRDGEVNSSEDYYWMDIATFSKVDGSAYSSQEGVIAGSNRRNDTYGTFISLCLPDIDDDSVRLQFDSKYVIYTNPEVYAILQASPYFKDANEAYDYVNNGGTSFSTSKGSSTSNGGSITQKVGVYTSTEVSLFGSAEMEAETSIGAGYEYNKSKSVEYEVQYNAAGGGEDQVVMYCMKYMYYVYDMYNPKTGSWDQLVLPVPMGISTSVIDVDDYDEIAERTNGLTKIRDNILKSRAGYPETYPGAVQGRRLYTYTGNWASSTSSSGADITQTISTEEEEEHTITASLEINLKVGGGGGFLGNSTKVGVTSSTEAGYSHTESTTKGMSFSGTVDNVPKDCPDYLFDWKLMVGETNITSSNCPTYIVGYDVRNVDRPPYMPMDLSVKNVTKNSISLSWEASEKVAYYEIYMVDAAGNYNHKATVPYTVTDYEVKELVPNRTYTFSVRSVDAIGAKSIYSPSVSASTLQNSANFKVTKDPQDTSTYSGGTAEFSAGGQYEDENGNRKNVGYSWQTNEDGYWSTIAKGGSAASLKLTGVNEDMDGVQYRCRVYYNDVSLYTKPATLTVDKAPSVSYLELYNVTKGESVPNESVVFAGGTIPQSREETVQYSQGVFFASSGTEYTLLTDGTRYIWKTGNGKYYGFNGTINKDANGNVPEGTSFTSSNVKSAELSTEKSDYKATIETASVNGGSTTITSKSYPLTKADVAEGETVSYTYEGIAYNKIDTKWTESGSKYNFYLLKDEKGSNSLYCYTNAADNKVIGVCSMSYNTSVVVDSGTKVAVSSLKPMTKTASYKRTVIEPDKKVTGETIKLTCYAESEAGEKLEGNVAFYVDGPNFEIINAEYKDGKYTANWTPQGEGTYKVYACYNGNDKYNESYTSQMTIYTSYKERQMVSLDSESSAQYGDSVNMRFIKVESETGALSNITEVNGTTYKVYKSQNGRYSEADAGTYSFSNGSFVPKATGNFVIKAENGGNIATKSIWVSKADLYITAKDTEKGINDSDRSCEDADVTGLKSWDSGYMPERDKDYVISSTGVTAQEQGTYDITNNILMDKNDKYTANMDYLDDRYNMKFVNAKYKLVGNVYTVAGGTSSTHGSIAIKYKTNKDAVTDSLLVESGTKLPENADVTFDASPAKGYRVKEWTLNGKKVTNSAGEVSGNGTYTGSQLEIDTLTKDISVVVGFEPVYHSLSFEPDNPDNGSLSAKYITNGVAGNAFGSGGNVHVEQTVRITASPKNGYTLDHWTVIGEDGVERTVKADDQITNYTGLSYDAKEISENTVITAYFAETEDFAISVSPVVAGSDGTTTAATGVDVMVTADRDGDVTVIEKNEAGKYEIKRGDNVTIEVTVPSGLLLDGWTTADGVDIGTVSTDLKKMTVYNVTSDIDYVVTYTAPNRYKLVFDSELESEKDTPDKSVIPGSIEAVVAGTTDVLQSGDKQLQGTDVEFTATPDKGYEIAYWEINGEKVETEKLDAGKEKYTFNYLGKDTKVIVYYYKQPVITWSSDSGIDVTARYGTESIESGACIPYKSGDSLVFEASSNKGYELSDITVSYGGVSVYKWTEADGEAAAKLAESASDTELYTFTWAAPEEGFACDVRVEFSFKKIDNMIKAGYSLKDIDKASGDELHGRTHGSIQASVSRKELPAYEQTGAVVSDETANKTAEITDIYRDSVITFKVTPDMGYNVKEWIIDGKKLTNETENIKLCSDKKTNDTLKITVTKDMKDITVMAGLELIGDVLTFGPETEGTGEVSAVIRRSGVKLVSGDMLGTTADVEFTAVSAEGYEVADWLVNGISQKVTDDVFMYKVPKDTRADVRAVFDRPFYNITWSSDEGGQIKAENVTADEVLEGNSAQIRGDRELKFTADADQYMECTGFTVKTAEGTKDYTAEELGSNVFVVDKVASDIDVVAHFAKQELKSVITFEANDAALGTVTAVYGLDKKAEITSGDSQVSGGDVVFTAAPAEGQMIEGWYLDPECTQAIEGTGLEQTTYEVKTIYSDVAVYVKFVEIPEYTVKVGTTGTGSAKITAASDGEELEIVSGEVKLKRHKNLTITVTPKDEYNTVEHWIVDGNEVASEELKYEITDITADTTVYAYIAPSLLVNVIFKNEDEVKKYDNINISTGYVGEDGDISGLKPINAENNSVRIGSGKDVRFAITPSDDYMIQSWTVKYIRGGNVVKEESGEDFGFVNDILLENVTNNIEVSAELVDREGYVIPAEGNYGRDNVKIEEASEETTEVAYTVSELTKIPDNVVFKDTNGNILDNVVRKNGDASVVITPAEGWRIRDIILGESDDNEEGSGQGNDQPDDGEGSNEGNDQSNGGEDPASSENIMKVQPVLAEDGTETGAYLVTAENVTKNVQFKVDAVKLYTVTITETEHGSVKVTRADGAEVKSGEQLDEETMLTYKATPDKYYDFDTWTYDVADQTESTFEQALDGNITVGAAFKARYAKVNIASVKNGKITVTTADGKKIANGQLVQEGTVIVCKAVPAKHCDLSAWGGDAKGKKGGTVKLIVTKNMKISAAFKYRYVKVAIGKTVNGTISVKTADGKTVKNGSAIKEGTVIVCTAKAAKNCKLGYWSGSFKSTKTSVRVAANNNMTINAKFVAQIPARDTAGINKNIQTAITNKSLTIKWGKVAGANGYDVFMQNCSKKMDTKNPVKTVRGASSNKTTITKMHGTALSKSGIVKIQVKAYKLVNGKKKYIDKSVLLHIVLNSEKRTNIKKVTLAKKAYTMSVKRAVTLKPVFTPANASKLLLGAEHGPRAFYYSTNTNVAIVDANGVIRAKASGKCTIYVISISGVTVPVQVTVR